MSLTDCSGGFGMRHVANEQLLVDALAALVGDDNVHVFSKGSMDPKGLEAQMYTFRKAQIIIGVPRPPPPACDG